MNKCISEVLYSTNQENRRIWWESYVESNHYDLKNFFHEWLIYIPVPPSSQHTTGNPDSPGYYIEKWDWLANTESGLKLTAHDCDFRAWFVDFLNAHGEYVKTSVDLLPPSGQTAIESWYTFPGTEAHPFDINDYIKPPGGFASFNDFFLRKVKSGLRPVDSSDIVSPSDGGIFFLIDPRQENQRNLYDGVELPGKYNDQFTITDGFPYWEHFVGGAVLDILLWFTDYHHFFAPVTGTVVCMADYAGSYNYDFNNFNAKVPTAAAPPQESDRVGWYLKFAKHRRFVWIIQTPTMGLVAMSAIGFWGVGSIVTRDNGDGTWMTGARAVMPGDKVKKGDYLGHFGYGGSSIVLAFEKNRNIDFLVGSSPDHPRLIKAGGSIGNYDTR
eukprot:CAMPEP_0185026882 /NCGR_PEP_ID=MMETSP1103-20130426/11446_1 /TAXON_ID=36769 /ORGANISM="Paraphysomonas bandaiensis, Strain Caron Lab Isolate" /LENGTH=384 /DNA_ID=CAMNT_0027560617 /DNA_START=119 /DNA_END=1273 /DNA_ORIENTATION=+